MQPADDEIPGQDTAELLSWLPLFHGLAPVFLELEQADTVRRVYGDPEALLGSDGGALADASFAALVHEKDIAIWRLVLKRLEKTRFVGPFPLRIIKPDTSMGAIEVSVAKRTVGAVTLHQVAIAKYHGQLSFDAGNRPPSGQQRRFEQKDFRVLADKLSRYQKDNGENAAQTLLRLAGVADEDLLRGDAVAAGAEALWAVHRLLSDAASEKAATDMAETKREQHAEAAKSKSAEGALEIKSAVRSAYHKGNETNFVTVAGEDGISEAEAVKAAVYAMKKAADSDRAVTMKALTGGYEKRLGKVRNQLRVFKKIVVQEKFDVALQPIVSLNDRSVHHFEALARFDASFYSGSPFEFMCFAEDIGVIHEFDLAMTMKVVSLLKRLRRIGFHTSIAVNISGRSIQSQGFLRHFFRILEDCADVRDQLSFELTESSQIDDLDTTNRILSRIRDFGHKVALDDFGAGAAGLQYLRVLKVDYVKIDGIYVRRALEDSENQAFLKSIANLCKGLDISMIGECIEVPQQEHFLSSIGVNFGQGWLYGKPQPVDEALRAASL